MTELIKAGDAIRAKVRIVNYGDGCFPDELVAEPGAVLQVVESNSDTGQIVVRHHGVTDHPGFYLKRDEYEYPTCLCDGSRPDFMAWLAAGKEINEHPKEMWRKPCFHYGAGKEPSRCRICRHEEGCHLKGYEQKESL